MLRVVSFNLLFGGQDRFDRILALVGGWRPDLLILQECLGWETGDRLADVAGALGLPMQEQHVHLGRARPRGSGSRYHVAILSRRPIQHVGDHADPQVIAHCVVECVLPCDDGQPLRVLGTHFDAHGEDERLAEARFVNARLAAAPGARALLAGDLNALSPRDPYPPDLAERLRRAGTDKYGHPPRFDAIGELEAAGWVDTLRSGPPPADWITARRNRGNVAIDYRTDYVFASAALAPALTSARVLPVQGASDHEAIEACFDV